MTLSFLTTASNWWGTSGILHRLQEHLVFTVVSMLIALALALPVAVAAGHTGRFGFLAINVSNIGRAIPSLAFLGLASQLLPRGYSSPWPTIIALVALAIPPLVTNTYVGMRQADPDAVEAARGMGLSPLQVALRVEFPLATPLVMAAVRTSVVNVIATVGLAALVAQGGFGRFIVDGRATNDTSQMVAGAILIAALAVIADLLLGFLARRMSALERARRSGRGPRRVRGGAPKAAAEVEPPSLPVDPLATGVVR
jgi:osmoprotectant transport system permease protein